MATCMSTCSSCSASAAATVAELTERAATYGLLARVFFKPLDQGAIDALAEAFPYEPGMGSGDGEVDDGRNDIARYLRRRHTGVREELAADFTGAFYGAVTVDGRSAMPYESLFRYDGGRLMGEPRGAVYRAFKASCVRVHAGLDLPEDHLSFLCSFMGLLCERTAACVQAGDELGARRLMEQQAAFFGEHVAGWYADFQELADRVVRTRFYRGFLKLARAFVEDEKTRLAPYTTVAAA